ncbi:MAG: hypothetical protein AAFN81_28710 [Bacteroidota bacterium]
MSNAITIAGSVYTVRGTVKHQSTNEGIQDLHVLLYDDDRVKDDFLGIGVTDAAGAFSISFDRSKFSKFFEREPDLYFIVKDGGLELLSTKDNIITDAGTATPPINLTVNTTNDDLRKLINKTPVDGWVGGFVESNPAFGYPDPDLSSLPVLDNLDNIPKLQRQQKVVWPEFSWETEPGEADPKRCYQMFAPDISRLGYTDEGRVFSIICPQQGTTSPHLGSMNVEVTVTGNRGWANEANKELAADMSVVGKIWFSPSSHEHKLVKQLIKIFTKNKMNFPGSKADAIVVETFKPGHPDQALFPLTKGLTDRFPMPDFAKHEEISWNVAHLDVEIGGIRKTGDDKADKFNQFVLDTFNTASGNMLKKGNILSWNVWFTAPELVDTEEWEDHAELWRQSIQADHGSPEGPGTDARYFDGTPFKPLKEWVLEELPRVMSFIQEHI